jgi:hypothetical protein
MCKSFFGEEKFKKKNKFHGKKGRSRVRHYKGITKTAAFGERRR